MADRSELYVVARRVLLDALSLLADHRDAVVLVGAQAVYLRSSDANLVIAAYTSDADLGIIPSRLSGMPRLEAVMVAGGFRINQPGQWIRAEQVAGTIVDIAVDLLVPESLAGKGGRRGARIPPHSNHATRKVIGLELAAVDNSVVAVGSLEPDHDHRVIEVKVAGVAALLAAKAYKIRDRLAEPGRSRLGNKDAGDVPTSHDG